MTDLETAARVLESFRDEVCSSQAHHQPRSPSRGLPGARRRGDRMRRDWERLYHGICPRCREHKFIGHGPLCADCYARPAPTEPEESK